MEFKQFGSFYLVRLEKGEELVTTLKDFCSRENITLGTVQGIGAVRPLKLGFFNPGSKKYQEQTFDAFYEMTSLSGNVSTKDGETYLHLHVNAASDDYKTVGGHLVSATVSLTSEIIINAIDGKAERTFNEQIGINLFDLRK